MDSQLKYGTINGRPAADYGRGLEGARRMNIQDQFNAAQLAQSVKDGNPPCSDPNCPDAGSQHWHHG